ncbi:hypothetical protein EDD15DRAFT_2200508 [Pisolithus albus]|nr:hypothetical protein EDD15DRAFT_2200508 [Pisolithus albus]
MKCGDKIQQDFLYSIWMDWVQEPHINRGFQSLNLIWCKTYPETCIKLFLDSHQEAVSEVQQHQQMSMQKEVYFQQVANAIFMHDHNPHIQQLYAQYLSVFIKPIKNRFQFHFRLHKKYNDANKTLGSTGAGLTAMELRGRLEMKSLLDKIVDTFPWWEDLHSFWRMNPSYNTVFSTAYPRQNFAVEAQQYSSGEKGSTSKSRYP